MPPLLLLPPLLELGLELELPESPLSGALTGELGFGVGFEELEEVGLEESLPEDEELP